VVFLWPVESWLRSSARQGSAEAHPTDREHRLAIDWASGFLNVAVFLACVFALKRFDISGDDLGHSGLTTIVYSACKGILTLHLLAICFTLGALLLQMWNNHARERGLPDLTFGISSCFLGASVLGLVGTVIGLAGLLKLPVVLVLVAPLTFVAPSYVAPYVAALLNKIRAAAARQDALGLTVHGCLACCLLIVGAVSLLWKALYPASAEADVWEHYLPYFREVLRTGSVGPGEVWAHYWASKAAGLIHLEGVLSDEFSAQLVSWVLIVMTTVIVIDLLRSALHSTAWALLGGIVFLSGVMTDPSIGAFARHHAAATAFIGFLVWAAVQMLSPPSRDRTLLLRSGLIVTFYAGLYLAQVVPLFVAFFGVFVVAGIVIRRLRLAVKPFAALILATIAGMLTEFLISYVCTGIASLVSVRVFWPIADQAKFGSLVGDSGMLYLLYGNNDNPPLADPWPWLARVFRLQHFLPLFTVAVAMMLAAAFARLRRANRVSALQRWDGIPAVVAGTFLMVSVVPPLLFRNESSMRLFIFLNLLVPIIALSILKLITDTCRETLVKRLSVATFLVVLSVTVVGEGLWPYRKHVEASVFYAEGRFSTAKALQRTADVYSEPERFRFVQAVRKRIGLESKIFTLTYAPGPASAFPGRGLMSEPLYSLGPRYLDMIFGTPDRAAEALRNADINYFHVSLEGKLFTGLAFSKLFRADNLTQHFALAYREGGQFLLTWRAPGDAKPLPSELTETLELKQKAVFVYPFGREFFEEAQGVVHAALERTRYCGSQSGAAVSERGCLMIGSILAESIEPILRNGMGYERLLPQNRRSVHVILHNVRTELTRRLPTQIPELHRELMSEERSPQDVAGALTRWLTTEVTTAAETAAMNACLERFARPLCERLTHRDDRIPFGMMYRSEASVANILRLNFTDVGTH
jgi:hypothetical protein